MPDDAPVMRTTLPQTSSCTTKETSRFTKLKKASTGQTKRMETAAVKSIRRPHSCQHVQTDMYVYSRGKCYRNMSRRPETCLEKRKCLTKYLTFTFTSHKLPSSPHWLISSNCASGRTCWNLQKWKVLHAELLHDLRKSWEKKFMMWGRKVELIEKVNCILNLAAAVQFTSELAPELAIPLCMNNPGGLETIPLEFDNCRSLCLVQSSWDVYLCSVSTVSNIGFMKNVLTDILQFEALRCLSSRQLTSFARQWVLCALQIHHLHFHRIRNQ